MYKKHNSFVGLVSQNSDSLEAVVRDCETLKVRLDGDRNYCSELRPVLDWALADLLQDTTDNSQPHFKLTPHVIAEINSYRDRSILPCYLFHRYRYELYPQLHELDDFPPYLQIEPASICNYRCVFCYQTDPTFTQKNSGFMGYMSLDLFKYIIDEAKGNVEFISLASRGEPLMCPEIESMLAYTQGKFLNLKMNTNASLLDERKCHAILQSGVKTLVFSADAADSELYSKLRVGGRLERVLSNVERFQSIRTNQYPDSEIVTRVSGVKVNDQQDLESMQRVWGDLVDQVAFVAYNPWENTYEQDVNDIVAPCSDLWRRAFIWWDGVVNPCDVDYKSSLAVGTIQDNSLSELWRSDVYQALRDSHLRGDRTQQFPCNRCTVV